MVRSKSLHYSRALASFLKHFQLARTWNPDTGHANSCVEPASVGPVKAPKHEVRSPTKTHVTQKSSSFVQDAMAIQITPAYAAQPLG